MSEVTRPAAPSGLGNAGKKLWAVIVDDLPADMEFDARELEILRVGCKQADLVAQLETAIKKDGVMITGAAGQRRLNAATTELRQSRVALVRMLGELGIPADLAQPPETASSKRGRRAAEARWGRAEIHGSGQGRLGDAT